MLAALKSTNNRFFYRNILLFNHCLRKMSSISHNQLVFRQLFEKVSSTYTYLLGDNKTKLALLIDPVFETAERDLKIIKELDLNLIYAINTHVHADHVTGTGAIKTALPSCKSIISVQSGAIADIQVDEGDIIPCGGIQLRCMSTPGHTDGCMTYILDMWESEEGYIFTGDAVLIRGCGRTDFQQGDAGKLYENVHSKVLSNPGHYYIYPAHDYKGFSRSTVDEEKKHNPRLTKTKKEFIEIMANLNLSYPKQIDRAVPANMMCGFQEQASI